MDRLIDSDTAAEVLAEFLGLLDDFEFDFEVKALYVESEFSDGNRLTLMQAHNHAYAHVVSSVFRCKSRRLFVAELGDDVAAWSVVFSQIRPTWQL